MNASGVAGSASGSNPRFWSGYWKSLKARAVEEPIDIWFHRPFAYVITRALLPTRVTPNMVTFVAMLFGIASGVCMVIGFPLHLQAAGLALVLAMIFDCADGQLARMRGTASPFGRIMDGCSDLVITIAFAGGTAFVVLGEHWQPPVLRYVAALAVVVAGVTTSFHMAMYDHFKNVFMKFTLPSYRDADVAEARERIDVETGWFGVLVRICWPVFMFYVNSQESVLRTFDPNTPKFSQLPPYAEERARIYVKHAERPLAVLRTWFGPGSLAFGVAVSSALGWLDGYILFRLFVLNAVFYGYVRPAQRRASLEAFREMNWTFDRAA